MEKSWEQELLELIHDVEEERVKAIQRLESAKKTIAFIDMKLLSMRTTLDAYRQKYGLPLSVDASESLATEFDGMNAAEMINHQADTHDGVVSMNRLVHATVAAGQYGNLNSARSSLYKTIGRLQEFKRVSGGIYRRQEAEMHANGNGGDF